MKCHFKTRLGSNVLVYIQRLFSLVLCPSVRLLSDDIFIIGHPLSSESKDQNWAELRQNDKQVRDILIRNGIKLSLEPMSRYCYRTESLISRLILQIRSAIIPNVIHLNTNIRVVWRRRAQKSEKKKIGSDRQQWLSSRCLSLFIRFTTDCSTVLTEPYSGREFGIKSCLWRQCGHCRHTIASDATQLKTK